MQLSLAKWLLSKRVFVEKYRKNTSWGQVQPVKAMMGELSASTQHLRIPGRGLLMSRGSPEVLTANNWWWHRHCTAG